MEMDLEKKKDLTGLAELLIKEQSAIEIMLMLTDEGPKTIEQISSEIKFIKLTDLLDKLRKFDLVDIKDDNVNITSYGENIVSKLRACVKDKGVIEYGRN